MPLSKSTSTLIPNDPESQKIELILQNHPLTLSLRQDPNVYENRFYANIEESMRENLLTFHNLLGPDKIAVPPLAFINEKSNTLIALCYLGSVIAGCPGMVHGGLLATLLDEGCVMCALIGRSDSVSVTLRLDVRYLQPVFTEEFYVIKARVVNVDRDLQEIEGCLEPLNERTCADWRGGNGALTTVQGQYKRLLVGSQLISV